MQFDAIVVGSGITGGWAAKAPWDLPFRGQGDAAQYQRECPV